MLKKLLLPALGFLMSATALFAQIGQGALKGKIHDKTSKEALPFVNVVLEQNGTVVTGAASDFDGNYTIKPVPPGKYDIKATFTGYQPIKITGVVISAEKIAFQNLGMAPTAIDIKEIEVIEYKIPLIEKDKTAASTTVTREEIAQMPGRSATSIAETVGGVYSNDDGSGSLNIRGSRSDANYYFIDGVKVRGSSSLPKSGIEQVTVITGGLPAQYGDITGGVVSITTRGAASEYGGSIDYSTSGYKLGKKVYGLDNYGFNVLEFSAYGPIYFLKDTTGKKTKSLLGFFLSGNVNSDVDAVPSSIGMWTIKDASLERVNNDPLRRIPGRTGTFLNHEYLRLSDFEKVKTKQNVGRIGANFSGRVDVNISKTSDLKVGGTFDYNKRHAYTYSNSLMNSKNNPENIDRTWRVYARFTQRFGAGEQDTTKDQKSASVIKNAYYSIQMDFSNTNESVWDDSHKDVLFNYGHVGKYKTYNARFFRPTQNGDSILQETFVDTLVSFEPGTVNPELAQFTNSYYKLYGWKGVDANGDPQFDYASARTPVSPTNTFGFYSNYQFSPDGDRNGPYSNLVNIQNGGGLRNGDQPRDIYSTWITPARQFNQFGYTSNSQFRIFATGSADIKDHAFSFGVEYEQRTDRGFTISPTSLWTAGRQYINSHIRELDKTQPTDISITQVPMVRYERLNSATFNGGQYVSGSSQSFFDYNVRNKLGLDPTKTEWIDFDSYSPETYKISMFSPDELLNFMNTGSNSYNYWGYNYDGSDQKGNPTVDDFFKSKDKYGNLTREVPAFRPIYMAGYIQDKFSFDDLVFNVGLRVDRFDANQKVLKDPYLLFPAAKANEDLKKYGLPDGYKIPNNVGSDHVVYVDDIQNPTSISGFRKGTTWYNAEGTEIDGPIALRTSTGQVAPLLLDKTKRTGLQIASDAFEDYKPQTNFMPRVAFSFPISDEALFFAHYDVLTKRPTASYGSGALTLDPTRIDPTDYMFIETRTSSELNNPNLRPEQTIDYEAGFQQKLNNFSSLKVSGFYREFRDQITIFNYLEAYPKTYRAYINQDYGTVKGFTVSYDLRRYGNIRARLAYTYQEAEGTGSDPTFAVGLARAGKPNLRTTVPADYDQRHTIVTNIDYRYGGGKDYNGPELFGKQILANTGANITFNIGSGTPYNRALFPVASGFLSPEGTLLLGSINGSRLPWNFRTDMKLDRSVTVQLPVKKGTEEEPAKAKTLDMNIYFQILNLFNIQYFLNVYRYTGNPDDDGYLQDPRYKTIIEGQNDAQSFRELYSMKINNPSNYSLPRRIRVGLLVSF